jgi:hypothetical protein
VWRSDAILTEDLPVKTYSLRQPTSWASAALALLLTAAPKAQAQLIINNGGFEAGLASWTRADQVGSLGTFALQTGTVSPVTSTTVPAPPGGIRAAMTDSTGPGSHVLFQDFVVPPLPIGSAQLRFDVFVGNRANAFFIPTTPTLDFSTPALNQQARVDILNSGTDPFSVSAVDVLTNAYQTRTTDPLVSGYTSVNVDVTALLASHAGSTLRLRFAEVDNVSTFQFGVDNISLIVSPIPEPTSTVLCGIGALIALARCRRNKSAVAMLRSA